MIEIPDNPNLPAGLAQAVNESIRETLMRNSTLEELGAREDPFGLLIFDNARVTFYAGIDGVPCFILGGVFAVSGAQSPEYLADAIERAAAERRAATPAEAQA